MQGSKIMKPWQFAVVGLALLATTGCRSDPNIPVLERQLRLQEDEIYRLQGDDRRSSRMSAGSRRAARPLQPGRSSRT